MMILPPPESVPSVELLPPRSEPLPTTTPQAASTQAGTTEVHADTLVVTGANGGQPSLYHLNGGTLNVQDVIIKLYKEEI